MGCGTLAACIAASPLLAQETVGGKFSLGENARFGSTVVGPGQHKFSIETVGSIQSIESIQRGSGHLVLVVLRPEQAGPVVSIFAMASPSICGGEGSELILAPEKQEMLAQIMHLEKEGHKVDFNWSSAKAKGQVAARQVEPRESAAGARTAGNY